MKSDNELLSIETKD